MDERGECMWSVASVCLLCLCIQLQITFGTIEASRSECKMRNLFSGILEGRYRQR